jgi:hypothetical protein
MNEDIRSARAAFIRAASAYAAAAADHVDPHELPEAQRAALDAALSAAGAMGVHIEFDASEGGPTRCAVALGHGELRALVDLAEFGPVLEH